MPTILNGAITFAMVYRFSCKGMEFLLRLSVVGCRLSVICYWLSVIGCLLSVVGCRLSVIGYLLSVKRLAGALIVSTDASRYSVRFQCFQYFLVLHLLEK